MNSDAASRRSGLVAGVALMFDPADRGGWQIGALVVQKGARNILRRDDAIRFSYLQKVTSYFTLPTSNFLQVLDRD